jgi:hypothetical protein
LSKSAFSRLHEKSGETAAVLQLAMAPKEGIANCHLRNMMKSTGSLFPKPSCLFPKKDLAYAGEEGSGRIVMGNACFQRQATRASPRQAELALPRMNEGGHATGREFPVA